MTHPKHITAHSIVRFRERVEPGLTDDEIRARLSTPAILAAVDLGHCAVRLPTGQRVVICNGRIVTVAPKPRAPKVRNVGGNVIHPSYATSIAEGVTE